MINQNLFAENTRGPREARTSEYHTWTSMRQRCRNPRNQAFKHYGGRGILVCKRWDSFDNFIADMGPKPSPEHTIEREDVNGNYEPPNCVWLHKTRQARNKTTTRLVIYGSRKMPLVEALELSGLSKDTVLHRVSLGMTYEQALACSGMPRGPRPQLQIPYKGRLFTLRELSNLSGKSKSALWYQIFDRGCSAEEVLG